MKKGGFQQLGYWVILVSLAGCAGTSGTNNSMSAADQGLSSVGSAVQGGQQLLNAGPGAAAAAARRHRL